jgi:hypothetical protein
MQDRILSPGPVNRLEFDRELADNERSDEITQPMAEPFTERQESVGSSGRLD